MNSKHLSKMATILLVALMAGSGRADVVETKNGARIVGTVSRVGDGSVVVATSYAGDIVVKQSEVASISTDAPVTVRLNSGTVLQGTVSSSDNGALKITGPDGELNTSVDRVAASWPVGTEDPQVTALRAAAERKWSYEAGVDIAGKTGNSEQLGTAVTARAVLKSETDKLEFYTGYNRQVTEGTKSADEFKAGVDYSNNFAGKTSWYVRDEGGFDRVKDIELYNVAAAGLGYDFIKKENQILTGRAGIAFRYEGYENPATEDVRSAGLDLGLNHEWTFKSSKIVNRISYLPAFEDFANYRIVHESFYEIPLAAAQWKLRLGVNNDYNSQPGVGVEKLDTTYFTRLVLTFE